MSDGSDSSSSKVERVINHYQLDGLADELEERWTGPSDTRASLRELADEVNKRVLQSAMKNVGIQPIDGEVENFYRLLTADDVSLDERVEAREKLAQNGTDVSELKDDFVSHQSVYTYLTDHRGVTYEKSTNGNRKARGIDKIAALENRTEAVTADTLRRLDNANEISVDEYSIELQIVVRCESCLNEVSVQDFIENGGCQCTHGDDIE